MKKFNLTSVSKFYNQKYIQYGNSLKSIGWSNKKDQDLRFEKLLLNYDLKNKVILDVGCGFGDLYFYIKKNFKCNFKYIGIDISNHILERAKKKVKYSNAKFYNCDLLSYISKKVDISVLSGSLTLNFKNSNAYFNEVIRKMYKISKLSCSINFMSSYCDYKLAKNKHFNPESIFKLSKKISNKVNLIHDYPLFEFTIQLIK